jgi:hypothetical protein
MFAAFHAAPSSIFYIHISGWMNAGKPFSSPDISRSGIPTRPIEIRESDVMC